MEVVSKNCHCYLLQSLVIYFCILLILLLGSPGLADVDDSDNQRTDAWSPCSMVYLVADPNYPIYLSNRLTEPYEKLSGIDKVNKISHLRRSLEGEGSHRRLISKLKMEDGSLSSTYLDGFDCELVIIESLSGVFADPFELQRLVTRKVYLDAAVFGDTNLELPSALSNSSFVEIHMNLVPSLKDNYELIIELPLHVRYPPLDGNGYAAVEIPQPDLYKRCRRKDMDKTCQWGVAALDVGATETLKWLIPCGDEAHSAVVSTVTFLSALVCALSIVSASIFYCPVITTIDQ